MIQGSEGLSDSVAAHLTYQAVSKAFTGFLQIVVSLQAHPECLVGSEVTRQPVLSRATWYFSWVWVCDRVAVNTA